jgi:pimeloyl-ACP methyl ester carboxylesterase
MTDKKTFTLDVPGAVLTYDVREPATPTDEPPLLIGLPMGAEGFATLASHFTDRTVVTYDPRGIERSTRETSADLPGVPDFADDVHRVIETVGGGPVDLFGSSGGGVVSLDLAARYPEDVRTVVAHEPPLPTVLPDRDAMVAAMRDIYDTYQAKGSGPAMAKFIALVMAEGELTADYAERPAPDPAMFGLPTEDDGSRDDLLLGATIQTIPLFEAAYETLRTGAPRVVIGVSTDSDQGMAGRSATAAAALLGSEPVVFPGGHGGFSGGEYGQPADKPVEFAAKLREVLTN